MIQFDHLKLVRRQPTEMARFRRWLLEAQPGQYSELIILHERDGRCCRRESWAETSATIIEAVRPPTPQVLVNLFMGDSQTCPQC
ncbi:MAG TPA: hypothetical protein VN688_01035 [Gemmataceae bacterium]|nr:hypothetical protein [Gemmataceae bacterium]